MIALRTAACCAGITLALCVAATQAHAATNAGVPRTLPSGPCDEDHILDIEIIDGVLYECACEERIFVKNDCGWQEITSQADDPMRFRRIVKWAKRKHLHIVVRVTPRPIAVARPAPVATITAAPAAPAGKCADPYLAGDAWAQAHGC